MLSIERCREVLGQGSDFDLEVVREQLYALADVAVCALMERQAASGQRHAISVPFSDSLKLLPQEDAEDAKERAAIIEFDAGRSRDEAEREALLATIRRHKAGTSAGS